MNSISPLGINPITPIIILILMVPIYFISKAVMNKFEIGKNPNRKYLAIIPSVVISPIIYLCTVFIILFYISYYPKVDFEETQWKIDSEKRYTMSRDLIKSQILIGLTIEQISDLLGPDFYRYDDKQIIYHIGYVPGIIVLDPGELHIYFDKNRVLDVTMIE